MSNRVGPWVYTVNVNLVSIFIFPYVYARGFSELPPGRARVSQLGVGVFVGQERMRRLGDPDFFFFFSSRRRHTRCSRDWSSDVCSSDLQVRAITPGSIVEPGVMARTWERMHRWALRRAACVVVLGDDMKNLILAKGIAAEKLEIVRDGTEIGRANAPALDEEVMQAIRGDFRFVLRHAGNIGFYRAW